IFDEEDRLLFSIDDIDLKAKAIRNSILPRLVQIVNELISELIDIYGVDFYSNNTLIKSPNYRLGLKVDKIKTDYSYCLAGFSGVRKSNYWVSIKKKSGKIAEVLPLQLQFFLNGEGFQLVFHNQYLNDYQSESYNLYLDFLLKYKDYIQSLLFKAGLVPVTWFDLKSKFIDSYENKLQYARVNSWNEVIFESPKIKYPIDSVEKEKMIDAAIILYPLYQSLIDISRGDDDQFLKYIEVLNNYKWSKKDKDVFEEKKMVFLDDHLKREVEKLIDNRITIVPSIRWQVFKRDNWKCLSCGKTADDGIILHVDHILPRSKGGLDELPNYQTLCNICNIGKSNTDQTNLRKR
ncbi:MAG TPA: HNH endonuclease, partial [Saprospiraceae bacterium]|nr:HNH endonuclease [Saprospiraceae bacterium]